jgi:hypothetical protein
VKAAPSLLVRVVTIWPRKSMNRIVISVDERVISLRIRVTWEVDSFGLWADYTPRVWTRGRN